METTIPIDSAASTTTGLCYQCRSRGFSLANGALINEPLIINHATEISEKDAKLLVDNDAFISSTPDTELQMGLGDPVGFRNDIKSHTSIGIDCHANNSSDILTQLRLRLQFASGRDNDFALRNGGYPSINIKLNEAFNLGTIQGAKAVNMEQEMGSLAEGKLADIVVFAANTPAMVGAVEENPVAAILLHASVRDIDLVIVDGIVQKEDGKLCDVSVSDESGGQLTKKRSWPEIVDELRPSTQRIKERAKQQDFAVAKEVITKVYS